MWPRWKIFKIGIMITKVVKKIFKSFSARFSADAGNLLQFILFPPIALIFLYKITNFKRVKRESDIAT